MHHPILTQVSNKGGGGGNEVKFYGHEGSAGIIG